jgi:RHS repeat-associated protein
LVIQNGITLADYDYNAVGNLTRTQFANGTQELRQFDSLNRLTSLVNQKNNGEILSSYTYTLDKVGNRLQVVENNGRTVNYSYDDLYRLTQEQILDGVNGNRTSGYTYDKVSNRLSKTETVGGTSTTTSYLYDANDRLLAEMVNGNVTVAYTYDNNGNTLTKTEGGTTTAYTWNAEDRMVGVTVTDANGVVQQQMQYQYDAYGMRVSGTVNGQETRYLLDTVQPYAQVLEEYSPDGIVKVAYIYGNDLISQARGSNTTYYMVDGLGSTRVLTDSQGNGVATYNYEAFGNLIHSTGSAVNSYLFTGEQFDANLDDYYLRQRYYNTSSGRFTRRDTWEGSLGEPLTLHKYFYGDGNPVSNTDPTGLFSMGEISAANTIRDIISQGYIDGGTRFLATINGSSFEDDLLTDLAVTLAVPLIGAFIGALSKAAKAAIAEGGWLLKHEEGFGGIGHTIEKHVGVSDQFLLDRLSETRKNGKPVYREASTFTDIKTAEKGVKENILFNKDAIRQWRSDPTANAKQSFDYLGDGTSIGRGILQGESASTSRYGTRVVLVKKNPYDPRTGFTVLTSHPI